MGPSGRVGCAVAIAGTDALEDVVVDMDADAAGVRVRVRKGMSADDGLAMGLGISMRTVAGVGEWVESGGNVYLLWLASLLDVVPSRMAC